jgi:osmotically-inducible protein OsmY
MAGNNRNTDNNFNEFNNDRNENWDRFNEQYGGRDPRYDDHDISGNRSDYNRVNYMPDNDDNRSFNERDYEDRNYGNPGTFGYSGDANNDYSRKMDRQSGNRKMRTNYGNNYQGWGGYNEDYKNDRNRYQKAADTANRDYYGNYNESHASNEPGKVSESTRTRAQEQPGYDHQRDLWDRSRDEVSSWFGDRDAERRREMDKTMGQHRGKGPRGYQRSEERIREDVCDRLTEDDRVDATDIEVKVEGTEVVLSGNVHSREEKRRAEDVVESIPGVKNVENRIHVYRPDDTGARR